MKLTKEMENIVLDLIVECDLNVGQPRRPMIRKTLRTLLEAFGEEVIGEDTYHTITDPDRIDAGKKAPHPYNDHRAEQRLKVKEIIEGVGK